MAGTGEDELAPMTGQFMVAYQEVVSKVSKCYCGSSTGAGPHLRELRTLFFSLMGTACDYRDREQLYNNTRINDSNNGHNHGEESQQTDQISQLSDESNTTPNFNLHSNLNLSPQDENLTTDGSRAQRTKNSHVKVENLETPTSSSSGSTSNKLIKPKISGRKSSAKPKSRADHSAARLKFIEKQRRFMQIYAVTWPRFPNGRFIPKAELPPNEVISLTNQINEMAQNKDFKLAPTRDKIRKRRRQEETSAPRQQKSVATIFKASTSAADSQQAPTQGLGPDQDPAQGRTAPVDTADEETQEDVPQYKTVTFWSKRYGINITKRIKKHVYTEDERNAARERALAQKRVNGKSVPLAEGQAASKKKRTRRGIRSHAAQSRRSVARAALLLGDPSELYQRWAAGAELPASLSPSVALERDATLDGIALAMRPQPDLSGINNSIEDLESFLAAAMPHSIKKDNSEDSEIDAELEILAGRVSFDSTAEENSEFQVPDISFPELDSENFILPN